MYFNLKMLKVLSTLVFCILILQTHQQTSTPDSPCPSLFMYETISSEPNRWYGIVNVTTDTTLYSVVLNVILDTKADILANWFGEVSTTDNLDFKIVNHKMKVQPGSPVPVRFFVQFNPLNQPPKMQIIRLNGIDICNTGNPVSTVDVPDNDSRIKHSQPDKTTEPEPSFTNRPSISNNNNNDDDINDDECGTVVRFNANVLATNSRPTLEGQWPWQVALYQTNSRQISAYLCGGTLVTRSHVITAAHCITKPDTDRVVNKNTLTIYLGKHNLRTSVAGVQIGYVQQIILHPQYNTTSHLQDLAILLLREDISITEWVRPACLWPDNEVDLRYVVGKRGTIVGWGIDETGVASEQLALVEMPVVDQETCIRSENLGGFFLRYTSDKTYCAGNRDGTSVCNGDSGGGMVFKKQNIWYLRGLVSLSVTSQNANRCDPTHYVVFTDLAKFLGWIREIIRNSKFNFLI